MFHLYERMLIAHFYMPYTSLCFLVIRSVEWWWFLKTHKSKLVGCASLLVTWPPSSQFLMHFAHGYTWLAISTYRPFPLFKPCTAGHTCLRSAVSPVCIMDAPSCAKTEFSSNSQKLFCEAKTSKDAFPISSSSSLLLSPGLAFRY